VQLSHCLLHADAADDGKHVFIEHISITPPVRAVVGVTAECASADCI
jgi:hypothetical protein